MKFTIGDGTAPPGFPAYGLKVMPDGKRMVRCNFKNCGHLGELTRPAKMECAGVNCNCPCCRFLAGARVHGCSYGAPTV